MPTIREGSIHVFTFRAGLLGRVGHNLRLSLQEFAIEFDPADSEGGDGAGSGEVAGEFRPDSLRVDGAMQDGELDRGELSASDRKKIRGNIRRDVLKTDDYPTAEFRGRFEPAGEGRWQVEGTLALRGEQADIATEVRRVGERYRAEVELVPTRWGIQPYKALMGALTLEDRVVVELELPVGER